MMSAPALGKLQQSMQTARLGAVILEPGPVMLRLTGVRWGRSERTFVVLVPQKGDPMWVLPAFEEKRARELIRFGEIRLWQEDESSFRQIAAGLQSWRLAPPMRIALHDTVRFFILDGIRREAPEFEYVSTSTARL